MTCNLSSLYFRWKTAEKWFLDALEKIKAIGNEVFYVISTNTYTYAHTHKSV